MYNSLKKLVKSEVKYRFVVTKPFLFLQVVPFTKNLLNLVTLIAYISFFLSFFKQYKVSNR